jgi:DNA-binding GntR family transcriptional regulator
MTDRESANDEVLVSMQAIADSMRGRYRTLEEMVIDAVRKAILDGVFAPGQRLPQDQIAAALDVSRIPVRSALRWLESEGLVVFHPHRGATVSTLTADDVAEIYEIRARLEKFALQAACERVTPQDLAELEQLAEAVDRAHDHANSEDWYQARQTFYRRLYEVARVPRTAQLIDRLRGEVGRYLHRMRASDSHGHKIIIEAMKSGDPLAAEQWLDEHLSIVSKDIQETVRLAHPGPPTQ